MRDCILHGVHVIDGGLASELGYMGARIDGPLWSRVAVGAAGKAPRYPVKITVFCVDRTGMLKELTAVISDLNTDICGVELKRDEEG